MRTLKSLEIAADLETERRTGVWFEAIFVSYSPKDKYSMRIIRPNYLIANGDCDEFS